MKSLSSSRREVLVDCFHVYTYNIAFLLLFVIAWPKIAWVICCHITEDIF